ncbi:MAG TPA: helix-turn-helix domain-containing protein [Candidatus Krumholzibacteria bacterium]|nr:helix-turn-helix domain-containing protein [Candidatus Krumholzibacteria bacterium]
MSRTEQLLSALRDLGLTPTEAEVYVATVEAAAEGPVSGYRVAQGLGRDPANLAKVMAGLVRQGAVRVVQEKPRLYLPVAPEDFIDGIVRRVQDRRDEAVALLQALAPADPSGAPLLVPSFAEAVAAAAAMIDAAVSSVRIHAPGSVLAALAGPLAAAAARPGCRVAVLCPEPVRLAAGESTLVPAPAEAEAPGLQVVCDRRLWLAARDGAEPAGCRGDQAAVAGVLFDTLDAARHIGEFAAERSAFAAAGGGADRTAAQAPAPAPAPARPKGEGLTFLIRHDRDEG